MSWLPLALGSAALLGLYDVAKKSSLDRNAVLPVLFACSLTGALLVTPILALSWLNPALAVAWRLEVAPLNLAQHLAILLKAGIVTTSWVLTFFAVKRLPISLAAPIRASSPLFTFLGAVLWFGEQPSLRQIAGIACILVAYGLFSLIGRVEGIHFERNRWVWMLFAGTLVGAASGLYDKHLLQQVRIPPMAAQVWFALYNAVLQGLLLWLAWWPRRRSTTPFQFRWAIVAVGVLLLLADNLYFRALALPGALVSVVSAVRRTNVVVSFALGSLVFREQQRGRKALALAGVLVGLYLILR